MKETIIRLREFLLAHVSNKKLQSLIIGLLSYEMVYYIFFGAGTFIIDIGIFSLITSYGCTALILNIISTICAIVFAYTTNKLWVFKSKTHGFTEVFAEFMRFAYVRFATLIMTEIILLINEKLINGNKYLAKLIAMIITIILNYVFSILFIFNNRKGTHNEIQKTA